MSSRRSVDQQAFIDVQARTIREYRNERGYKQVEVAEAVGITSSQMSLYESGTAAIPTWRLRPIAEALEVPVQRLIPKTFV